MRITLYGVIGIVLLALPSVKAQQYIYNKEITLSKQVQQQGDSVIIELDIDANRLHLPSVRSLTLTPILVSDPSEQPLEPILMNGRNRHKVYERDLSIGKRVPGEYYTVVKTAGKRDKIVHYRQALPYAAWMQGAQMMIRADLCGCGGHTQVLSEDELGLLLPAPVLAPKPYQMEPMYSYLDPVRDTRKQRTELKDIYLNFPVNQVVIYPDYMNNTSELSKAREMIESINADQNLHIEEVLIRGYASPEGSVPSNYKLSEGRAAALKNYLIPRLSNAARQLPMRSESGGEDWQGTIELLQTATFTGHDHLLDAIRKGDRSDAAEMALRNLDGGLPYSIMLKEIYPKVRRVVCSVTYSIREFTVEEGRQLIGTHPEQLSVYELYQIALSYPEESEEYFNTLRTAVRIYPTDETARINAATVALIQGKADEAASLLEGIQSENAAYENTLGLLLIQQDKDSEAEIHFRKAAEAGSEAAVHNLSELNKKRIHATK